MVVANRLYADLKLMRMVTLDIYLDQTQINYQVILTTRAR